MSRMTTGRSGKNSQGRRLLELAKAGDAEYVPALRLFIKSAKGAARTTKRISNLPVPHSVLREFLGRAAS